MSRWFCVALVLCMASCGFDRVIGRDITPPPPAAAHPDPDLARDQAEYVEDVMAFTHTSSDEVRAQMANPVLLRDEWIVWEQQGEMTPERIQAFYKQTKSYIYELGQWHLFAPGQRGADIALFADLRAKRPKNVLDFGGGVGLLALPLARGGLDVTLADLDSTSLAFAQFRAQRRSIALKVWKSDVEPAPPYAKYDVILCMDVLEHLPKDVLHDVIDKLIRLKHAKTEVIISAPFGHSEQTPMHFDLSDDTEQQIRRLRTEVPAN
jgi:methyltransferase family protein